MRPIGYARIHVFRSSARPRTAATRMADQVAKKARAATPLAVSVAAREAQARRRVGTEAAVLFEARLDDGRWMGNATDHTLVVAIPRPGEDPLENVGVRVAIESIDPTRHDRVVGRILSVSPPSVDVAPARSRSRPVLAALGAAVHAP